MGSGVVLVPPGRGSPRYVRRRDLCAAQCDEGRAVAGHLSGLYCLNPKVVEEEDGRGVRHILPHLVPVRLCHPCEVTGRGCAIEDRLLARESAYYHERRSSLPLDLG